MITDLKPYAEYKESGLPWLGQVPGHWEVRRAKFLLREIDARSQSGREQLLRVSQYTGVTQRKSIDGADAPDTRAESLVGYKRVRPDDLVINIMLAWNGSMGVSRHCGIASPAYCVYRFSDGALPWYFHELLRSPSYKQRIKTASTGVVESRLRLYSDDLGRIELLLPPPDEQAEIVRFLDWANGRLERAIRAKRKVIALLNEQKQAIIHRAVTRGLDPSVPLKDSGVPWLGEIPAHWEVRKIKQCASRFFAGGTPDSGNERYYTDSESGTPWLVIGDVSGQRRVQGSANRITEAGRASRNLELLPAGTVVLAMYASVGATAILDSPSTVNQALIGIAPREHLIGSDWLLACLEAVRPELLKQASASTQANLNAWKVRNIVIPLPPVSEQQDIVVEIDRNLGGFQSAISRLEREIGLLREYRTRLVADVVTGKLDVRAVAATLPDQASLDMDLGVDIETAETDGTVDEEAP